MFELGWIDALDGDSAGDAVAATHRDLLEADARLLYLAGHWADLHNGDALDAAGRVLPGMEQARRLGGPGTPRVAEFACAEFAALQQMHPLAGQNLIRDALNLRHRHPRLWARAVSGQVRTWQAREIARLVGRDDLDLTREQAGWIDAQTTTYLDSLPWGRFLDLLEAKIIEADPDAADARRKAAEAERFVATGKTNEHGLKTLIAKATAGDVIWFIAMVNRIADALAALYGDRDPVEVRRSKAIGILANPARALHILDRYQTYLKDQAADHDDPEQVAEGDVHPTDNDADDPESSREQSGDPGPFTRPDLSRIDPTRLLPPATLYIHISQEAFVRNTTGVARFEGAGPVTLAQVREFLGEHAQVSIKPVIDLADQAPVDGYEVPDRLREAVRLINPADIFPYAVNTGPRKDLDHPTPYVPPDHGGPPGQTGTHNLGPMTRFHHRIKTHGRWSLKQPFPGI